MTEQDMREPDMTEPDMTEQDMREPDMPEATAAEPGAGELTDRDDAEAAAWDRFVAEQPGGGFMQLSAWA